MALSMGLPGKDHVKEHLDLVVEKTIQKNKIAAATHSGPDQFDEYEHFFRLGARVLSITSLSLLKDSALNWQKKIRQIR